MPPTLPTNLPDVDWILSRYGVTDSTKAAGLRATYGQIIPLVLDLMSRYTAIPFPSATFTAEPVYFSGRLDVLVPTWWPVTQVTRALLGGITPLVVGTPLALATGSATLAIVDEGAALRVRGVSPRQEVFLDYKAGYDTLPLGLLEAFTQLAFVVAKEVERIGETSEKMDQIQTTFTRKLPDQAQRALNSYRRMYAFA